MTINNLGQVYYKKGDYKTAEEFYQRSLEIRKKALGSEHSEVAQSLNDLAVLYRAKGDYDRAEQLLKQTQTIYEKALGSQHPNVAKVFNNLAQLNDIRGNVAQAISFQANANEIEEYNLGLIITAGTEEQRQAYMKTFAGTTFGTVSLHIQDAPNNIQAARLALTTVLRRKGRVLDALIETRQSLRERLSPEDQMRLDELKDTSSQLSTLYFSDSTKMNGEQHQRKIAELKENRHRLETALSSKVGEFRAQSQPVTLALIQKMIPEEAALVEVVLYQPLDATAIKESEQWGTMRYTAYVLRARWRSSMDRFGRSSGN